MKKLLAFLPIVVGVVMGFLLMRPPAWLKPFGLLGYAGLVAVMAVCFLLFIAYVILQNLPADLRMVPLPPERIPEELKVPARQLAELGFREAMPPVEVQIAPPATLAAFVHETDRIYATAFRTGTIPAKTSYDLVSIFDGERGGLTTGPEVGGAALPSSPGSLRQIFPGATIPELVDHHRRALLWLRGRGITARALSGSTFESDFQGSFARQRRHFLRNPLGNTIVTIFRAATHTTPHRGPVEKQAIAARQIEAILSGKTVGV